MEGRGSGERRKTPGSAGSLQVASGCRALSRRPHFLGSPYPCTFIFLDFQSSFLPGKQAQSWAATASLACPGCLSPSPLALPRPALTGPSVLPDLGLPQQHLQSAHGSGRDPPTGFAPPPPTKLLTCQAPNVIAGARSPPGTATWTRAYGIEDMSRPCLPAPAAPTSSAASGSWGHLWGRTGTSRVTPPQEAEGMPRESCTPETCCSP